MKVRDFLRLHEHGIPVPWYTLNFAKKNKRRLISKFKEVFDGDNRVTLLVDYEKRAEYYENMSMQDAIGMGRFFELDKGLDVLYIEHTPVLWYMNLMLYASGAGSFQILSGNKIEEEVMFLDFNRVEDIQKRAMCRFGKSLFIFNTDSPVVTANIGWSGCFFGEPPSRFLVKDYNL